MLSINPINQSPNNNFYEENLQKISGVQNSRNDKKLQEAAKAFEAMLVYRMFKSMQDNVGKNGLINENQGEKIFKDFLLKERSENIVDNSKLGLAKMIYNQFSKYVQ